MAYLPMVGAGSFQIPIKNLANKKMACTELTFTRGTAYNTGGSIYMIGDSNTGNTEDIIFTAPVDMFFKYIISDEATLSTTTRCDLSVFVDDWEILREHHEKRAGEVYKTTFVNNFMVGAGQTVKFTIKLLDTNFKQNRSFYLSNASYYILM